MKKEEQSIQEILNVEKVAQSIFNDLLLVNTTSTCPKCSFLNEDKNCNKVIKCTNCNFSYHNKNIEKINFQISNDKVLKLLICMIRDFTIEETIKFINSNAETIKKNWIKLYNLVNWDKYNITVREEPIKRIYADFEVILN